MRNLRIPLPLPARYALCLVAAWIAISISGCASTGHVPAPKTPTNTEVGWWYASFQITWPQDEEPAWHNDLIIAHRIVAPVLDRYRNDIPLWRFHRRAVRDPAGHQFSFIFYSTSETARKVYAEIDAAPLLQEMKSAGLIAQTTYDDTTTIARPGMDGTSDPNWSRPVRNSWPYFIMGVSQLWLDLIGQFADDGRPKPSSLDQLEASYLEIDKEVRQTWAKEGGHAFLHHLNAAFGYSPVIIYQKYLMRF